MPRRGTKPPAKKKFPNYLKQEKFHLNALKWLGRRLTDIRGKQSLESVAKKVSAEGSQLDNLKILESGNFSLGLGHTRELIRRGYGIPFRSLLREFYDANKQELEVDDEPFETSSSYTVRFKGRGEDFPQSHFIIGGERPKFLWAVPLRQCKNQPMEFDFLELAHIKKKSGGETKKHSHSEVEIIHVIFGKVEVLINKIPEKLKAGETIHFLSSQPHKIINGSNTSVALILVIRTSELPP